MLGGVLLSMHFEVNQHRESQQFPTTLLHNSPVSSPAPSRSYLVCATPRSGSTLLCEALNSTGVAGVAEEYFEALRQTGHPRRPQEYFKGVDDPTIAEHLGEYARADDTGTDPLWSRKDYEPYFESVLEKGTTPNGV